MNITELESKTRDELLDIAKELGVSGVSGFKKQELAFRLLQYEVEQQGYMLEQGILEIMNDGYGFLRGANFSTNANDVYVSQSQIRRFGLRSGDMVTGQVRPPKNGERYRSMVHVEAINNLDPEQSKYRPSFESLVPIFPNTLIDLEKSGRGGLAPRLINLIAPIGRGQRGLIVSPPQAGKTLLLKSIANAASFYDDLHIMICLVGERPEEVTDMRRSVDGEVIGATFDEPVEVQTRVSELTIERAKRLVEMGKDVLLLLDGITRLTRAYNLAMPSSGRTLSGGVDPAALYPAKRFFGTARNLDSNGSLTIIATCLIDTGSRMDELIYEEFKGTGNMELHLDRKLAERRIFPAIDIGRSGTRREELLMDEATLKQVYLLRRMVQMMGDNTSNSSDVTERIMERLTRTKNNVEFLATLNKGL